MAKQMLIDAYRGKKTVKPPWVPYAGVHCAFIINEPADKFLQDPELLAKGLVATAKRYKADGIPLLFVTRESSAALRPERGTVAGCCRAGLRSGRGAAAAQATQSPGPRSGIP